MAACGQPPAASMPQRKAHLEQITAAGTVRDDGQLPIHAYDAAGISEARDGAVWIATESAILRLTPPASR